MNPTPETEPGQVRKVPDHQIDTIFPPQYDNDGELCKPSVLDPMTGTYRRLMLDFDDETIVKENQCTSRKNSGEYNFSILSLALTQHIIGGALTLDKDRDVEYGAQVMGERETIVRWSSPQTTMGSITKLIAEANRAVSLEHRVSIPYSLTTNGYTHTFKSRGDESNVCAGIFVGASLATGIDPITGDEHPIRPVHPAKFDHDFFGHMIDLAEVLQTMRETEIWRKKYTTDTTLHSLQPETNGNIESNIVRFAKLIDDKSFDKHNWPGNREVQENYRRCKGVLLAHGVSLSDIPIVS